MNDSLKNFLKVAGGLALAAPALSACGEICGACCAAYGCSAEKGGCCAADKSGCCAATGSSSETADSGEAEKAEGCCAAY